MAQIDALGLAFTCVLGLLVGGVLGGFGVTILQQIRTGRIKIPSTIALGPVKLDTSGLSPQATGATQETDVSSVGSLIEGGGSATGECLSLASAGMVLVGFILPWFTCSIPLLAIQGSMSRFSAFVQLMFGSLLADEYDDELRYWCSSTKSQAWIVRDYRWLCARVYRRHYHLDRCSLVRATAQATREGQEQLRDDGNLVMQIYMSQQKWRLVCIALFLCIAISGCISPEQAKFLTQVAEVGQTAAAIMETAGPPAQTQMAQAAQTAIAIVETVGPPMQTRIAQPATEAARQATAITTWKVGLDPGHGWNNGDPGAIGNDLQEKDVTLDIAVRTKAILENNGFQVIITRIGDDEHDLSHAANVINEQNLDIAVSIHANSGGISATGTEACYTVGKSTDAESSTLASLLTDSISTQLSLTNRGIFPENSDTRCARKRSTGWNQLYIHDMNPPTALIETAFISNPSDADLLRNRSQDFAQAIADAIIAYLQTH